MAIRKATYTAVLCGLMITGAVRAAPVEVSQKDKTFAPDDITLSAGSALHITNDDSVAHNIQVAGPDGTNQNLGVQKAGDVVDVPFDKAGAYTVHCGIHPKMKLFVHVQ